MDLKRCLILGRRVFIRFDLVNDNYSKGLAWIKVKSSFVDGQNTQETARAAFLELFQKDDRGLPTQVVCHRAGQLAQAKADELLTKIIHEHSRQNPLENDESRIRYRFLGGNEERNDAHNCLTWLRYMLRDFDLTLPRAPLDRLYADPQSVLPSGSLFFTPLLKTVNTQGWAEPTPESNDNVTYSRQRRNQGDKQ